MQVRTDEDGCALGNDIVKALTDELDIEHDAAVEVALAVADSKNMGKLARGFAAHRLQRIQQLVADSKDKVVSSAAEAKVKIDAKMAEAQEKLDSKVTEAKVKVTAHAEQAGQRLQALVKDEHTVLAHAPRLRVGSPKTLRVLDVCVSLTRRMPDAKLSPNMLNSNPYTRHSKPETRNPKPGGPNPA
jgi:hypothetical protein